MCKTKPYLVGMLLSGLLVSCDSSSIDSKPIQKIDFETSYIRNHVALYSRVLVVTDPAGSDTTRETYIVGVTSINDNIFGLSDLLRIETSFADSSGESDVSWYRQTPDQLVEVAYRIPSGYPPVAPKTSIQHARGPYGLPFFEKMDNERQLVDTTIVREDPRVVLQYPAESGIEVDIVYQPVRVAPTCRRLRNSLDPGFRLCALRSRAYYARRIQQSGRME